MKRLEKFKKCIELMHHSVERFYDVRAAEEARDNANEILSRAESNKSTTDDENYIDELIENYGASL